jgi:hypothetical protein
MSFPPVRVLDRVAGRRPGSRPTVTPTKRPAGAGNVPSASAATTTTEPVGDLSRDNADHRDGDVRFEDRSRDEI